MQTNWEFIICVVFGITLGLTFLSLCLVGLWSYLT